MTVYIYETAFLSIVLSSVEAYKKECYGLILGYRTDKQWRVEYAVPYQTAERGHKTVTPHGLRDRTQRINHAAPIQSLRLRLFDFRANPMRHLSKAERQIGQCNEIWIRRPEPMNRPRSAPPQ